MRLFLAGSLLAVSISVQAQTFAPGLLVTTTGDTLRGEIENNYWVETPQTVRFRPTPDAPAATYSPTQVRLFRLTGGRYFRTELVPLDRTAENRSVYVSENQPPAQQPETVFTEVLVEGPAPLLRLSLPGATHYFIRRETKGFIELTDRRYVHTEASGARTVVDANNYRGQLTIFFGDCAAATQAAASAAFTPQGLANVVQAYNQYCSAGAQAGTSFLTTAKSKRALSVNAGLLAGAQLNSLVLRQDPGAEPSEEGYSLDGLNVANRLHPLAGLYADLLFASRKFAFHGDLTVNTIGKSGQVKAQGPGPSGEYQWKGLMYTARLGVRYFVPVGSGSQRLFFGSGLALDKIQVRKSSLRYGDGSPRPAAGGLQLPGSGPFLEATQGEIRRGLLDFGGSLPYLEVGLRQGRLSAALDARVFMESAYYDDLALAQAFYYGTATVQNYSSPRYATRLWVFNATLGYRLGNDHDQQPSR